MAVSRINVSTDEMENYALKLRNVETILSEIKKSLDECMGRLAEEWEGDSFDGYYDQYQQIEFKFSKTIEYIESFAETIHKTSENFAAMDKELADSIKNFSRGL